MRPLLGSLCYIIIAIVPASALQVSYSFGGGYSWNADDDTPFGKGGISIIQPVVEDFSVGLEYNIVSSIHPDFEAPASLFELSCRKYFYDVPAKYGVDSFYPFAAVLPAVLYRQNRDLVPGIEIQLGFDLMYETWMIDPISYSMSWLARSRQLISVVFYATGLYMKDYWSGDSGIRVYSGTLF